MPSPWNKRSDLRFFYYQNWILKQCAHCTITDIISGRARPDFMPQNGFGHPPNDDFFCWRLFRRSFEDDHYHHQTNHYRHHDDHDDHDHRPWKTRRSVRIGPKSIYKQNDIIYYTYKGRDLLLLVKPTGDWGLSRGSTRTLTLPTVVSKQSVRIATWVVWKLPLIGEVPTQTNLANQI